MKGIRIIDCDAPSGSIASYLTGLSLLLPHEHQEVQTVQLPGQTQPVKCYLLAPAHVLAAGRHRLPEGVRAMLKRCHHAMVAIPACCAEPCDVKMSSNPILCWQKPGGPAEHCATLATAQ